MLLTEEVDAVLGHDRHEQVGEAVMAATGKPHVKFVRDSHNAEDDHADVACNEWVTRVEPPFPYVGVDVVEGQTEQHEKDYCERHSFDLNECLLKAAHFVQAVTEFDLGCPEVDRTNSLFQRHL